MRSGAAMLEPGSCNCPHLCSSQAAQGCAPRSGSQEQGLNSCRSLLPPSQAEHEPGPPHSRHHRLSPQRQRCRSAPNLPEGRQRAPIARRRGNPGQSEPGILVSSLPPVVRPAARRRCDRCRRAGKQCVWRSCLCIHLQNETRNCIQVSD